MISVIFFLTKIIDLWFSANSAISSSFQQYDSTNVLGFSPRKAIQEVQLLLESQWLGWHGISPLDEGSCPQKLRKTAQVPSAHHHTYTERPGKGKGHWLLKSKILAAGAVWFLTSALVVGIHVDTRCAHFNKMISKGWMALQIVTSVKKTSQDYKWIPKGLKPRFSGVSLMTTSRSSWNCTQAQTLPSDASAG